jgi:hypothetical protein
MRRRQLKRLWARLKQLSTMQLTLLRTNLLEEDPAKLWSHYLLLVAVEEAFKNLNGDLAIRPIFHQIEAECIDALRVPFEVGDSVTARCFASSLNTFPKAPGLTPLP